MRLLLSGYYGFGNTGDEAILEAVVAGIRRSIPEAELCVLSADPTATAQRHGLEAANRWDVAAQLRQIRMADALIQGGGGLYQDSTSRLSVLYYLNQLWMARLLRTPYVILAQGVGPLRSTVLRSALVSSFAKARLLTLRDHASAGDLEQWGLRTPPPVVTADPVLQLRPCADARTAELLEQVGLGAEPYTVVALRHWPGVEAALGAVAQYLSTTGRSALLLPFQYDQDIDIARQLQSEVGEDIGRVPPAALEPTEIMGVIARADEVLAMRLHALIMACAVGTTAAGLAYDPKVNAFCRRSGQAVMDLQLVERGEVDDLIAAARDARQRVEQRRQALIAEAGRTFELLAEVCGRLR